MELKLHDFNTSSNVGVIELPDSVFGCELNESLIHQTVTWYLANARQGTHGQKTRSEVRGGGRKPRPQKGGGGSRAGTIRSPLWRKGGKVFAAVTQDYSQKLNKKMFKGAIRSILSELVREGRIKVYEEIQLDSHKTKDFVGKLNRNQVGDCVIFIDDANHNLELASSNLPNIKLLDLKSINPVDLLKYKNVLLTKSSAMQLGGQLQ